MADAKIITYGEPFSATTDVVPDNQSVALDIESVDGKDYIQIDTTDSAEKLILAGGGAKVGISAASPDALLHVQDTAISTTRPSFASDTVAIFENDVNCSIQILTKDASSSIAEINMGGNGEDREGCLRYIPSELKMELGPRNASSKMGLYTANNQRIFIDDSGKISTGGETSALSIAGGIHIQTAHDSTTPDPALVLVNATASNVLDHRKSAIWFRGVNGGSTEHTLAKIEGFAQNSADSGQAGNIDLVCNTGGGSFNRAGHFNYNNTAQVGVCDGAPAATFHVRRGGADIRIDNITGADTAAARIAALEFFGRRSGDEAVEQGQIHFAHEGTADDDKSYMVIETNNGTSSAERLRISSAGYVGVGTNNPTTLLHATTAAAVGVGKFAQTHEDNQATTFTCTTECDDRGPVFFGATHATFADGGSYGVLRIDAKPASGTGFALISASANDGADLKFKVRGDGAVSADAAYSGSGADYSEYFETADGQPIAAGSSVVLDGDKVRLASAGEQPIGVVRPVGSSSVVGNDPWNHWKGRYLRDDFGAHVKEAYTVTKWIEEVAESVREGGTHITRSEHRSFATDKIPSDVVVPDSATVSTTDKHGKPLMRQVENPDYDESLEYVTREDRDEWVIVGLLGQVPVLKDQVMGESWVKMRDVSDSVEFYFIK